MNNAQGIMIRLILILAYSGIFVTHGWSQKRFIYHKPGDEFSTNESIFQKASVDGKYERLIGTLKLPLDRKEYGSFKDDGYWQGGTYQGIYNLPAGYWVYVAPTWYVWKHLTSAKKIPNADKTNVLQDNSSPDQDKVNNTSSQATDLTVSDPDHLSLEKALYLSKLYKISQYSYHSKFIGYRGYAAPVVLTNDGGALIFGNSLDNPDKDAFLIKVDQQGKQEWIHTFEPQISAIEAQSVVEDESGTIYVFVLSYNYALSRGGTERIICLDKNGNVKWSKLAGKYAKEENPHFSYIQLLDDGRIYTQGHYVPGKDHAEQGQYHYLECWIERDGELSLKIGPVISDWKPWLAKFQPDDYDGSRIDVSDPVVNKPTWQMTEVEKLAYMKKIASKYNIIDPVISYSFQGPAPPPGGYLMVSGFVVNRKGEKERVLWFGRVYFTDRGESPSLLHSK